MTDWSRKYQKETHVDNVPERGLERARPGIQIQVVPPGRARSLDLLIIASFRLFVTRRGCESERRSHTQRNSTVTFCE